MAYDRKESDRKYYQSHKQELAERNRKYRQTHKQELAERNRKYRQTHKQELAERNRKYYQSHKQELAEYNKVTAPMRNERIKLLKRINDLRAMKATYAEKHSKFPPMLQNRLDCYERLYELHFIEKKEGLPKCVVKTGMKQ